MLIGPQNLADNLRQVRSRIAAAATRAGRSEESITLVAVSKAQPLENVLAAARLGQRQFGENYPQEGIAKIDALQARRAEIAASDRAHDARVEWHFIGQLQSNKTRPVAERFDWVHSVDRNSIARRLHDQRPYYAAPLNVLLQVKLADEAAKGGVLPGEVAALAGEVAAYSRLRLRGLMCIPPAAEDAQQSRVYFRRLHELLTDLRARGFELDSLSMGMSADYEVAIEEGATHVRVGTAIFGPREGKQA
jgi:pyridoxal phosphate enzyme (YggS family)